MVVMRTLSVVVALAFLVSCSADGSDEGAGEGSSVEVGSSASASASGPAAAVDTGPAAEDPACTPGPGREVELLDDVTSPAVEVPAVVDADSGEELAAGFTVPAQVVDAGCIVRYAAPGGCLGAVEITGASIPGAVIPETVIGTEVYPEVTIPGVSQPGARAEQVCQVERGGDLPGVTRAGVVREGFSRNGAARSGDDLVATVRLEAVRLPDVDVDPERLETQKLEGSPDVDVLAGETLTSYVAPAGVLFDSDQAVLKPAARTALRAIARTIGATAPGRPLLVEGHTDDRGDADYGLALSERRADAVADWLVDEAGFDRSAIETRGWGETRPAYPNDSDVNRARNRRVVITVLA